ncbi:MAG: tRNA lysidine(34) synthetase TilS [Clostridia bacterium]|nr:tRNA lysidine(34) synthetase TilS [Clostridia bacterium]
MQLRDFSGKKICVAVSGGADSVALLHYLKTAEKQYGYTLCAVHCEHGIRGEESVADMRFVQELCKGWEVPLYTFAEDCPARSKRDKESLETAARNFRRESFSSLVLGGKADFIATAHHAGDEAETVLFRIARGASLTGAGGIAERSGYMIRPFLSWTKEEILEYVKKNALEYREDKTNADTRYARNKIRHEVLPKLEETVGGAAENIARFARLATEDDELLYEYANGLITETGGEYLVAFSEKKPLFRRACLTALKGLGADRDYTALHLQQAYALQDLRRGAKLDLPQEIEAERTENGVVFRKKTAWVAPERTAEQPFGEYFDGGAYTVRVSEICPKNGEFLRVDGDKIPQTAVFRFRKEGDKIERFGGGGKSLKKFFNEKKIPVKEREYLPLIAEKESGEVYAVCGVEISEKVKVRGETERVLYIVTEKK